MCVFKFKGWWGWGCVLMSGWCVLVCVFRWGRWGGVEWGVEVGEANQQESHRANTLLFTQSTTQYHTVVVYRRCNTPAVHYYCVYMVVLVTE